MDELAGKRIGDAVVTGGFSVSLNINGRTIQMTGYIQEGETKADLNRRIDLYQEVIDRQMVRADTKSQEGLLKGELAALEKDLDTLDQLTQKKDSGEKLSSQHKSQLAQMDARIKNLKTNIEMRREIIQANNETLALQ